MSKSAPSPPPWPATSKPPTMSTWYCLRPGFAPPTWAAPAIPPPQPPPPPQTKDAAPQPTLHRCCSPPSGYLLLIRRQHDLHRSGHSNRYLAPKAPPLLRLVCGLAPHRRYEDRFKSRT